MHNQFEWIVASGANNMVVEMQYNPAETFQSYRFNLQECIRVSANLFKELSSNYGYSWI